MSSGDESSVTLPINVQLKNGLNVQLARIEESDIPQLYALVQESILSGKGGSLEEFPADPTDGSLSEKLQYLSCTVKATLVKEGDIVGAHIQYPSLLPRSVLPVSFGEYTLIHPRYQNLGLGDIFLYITLAVAKESGYMEYLGRVARTNMVSMKNMKKLSTTITACIPSSLNVPGIGPVDDFIFRNDFSDEERLIKMTKEDVLKRINQVKPMVLLETRFQGPPVNVHSGHIVIRDATSDEEDGLYLLFSAAATAADNFAIDEFPNKKIFLEHFLNGRKLLSVLLSPDNLVIGAAVVGNSRLCRDKNPKNAGFLFYLKEPFSTSYYRSFLFNALEEYCRRCGFTGILHEQYVRGNLPCQFLRQRRYMMIGYVPNSGYLDGQGWSDSLIFLKKLSPVQYAQL